MTYLFDMGDFQIAFKWHFKSSGLNILTSFTIGENQKVSLRLN